MMHQKSPSRQIDVSSDTLILKESNEVPDAVAHSAMQVHEALVRRGIALVFADLIDHVKYTRYLSTLFNHMHREPPPGYTHEHPSV